MSGLGGVTRGVAVVNSASSASGSDAEDASPSGTRGASGGNRSKKEALRLAGEAYFDRVLSEAGGKAGFGANKMSSAAGGAAGKSGGGAGVSTGYALGLGESANRKGGGSSHKGNTDDPIMDDEDQAALDAIEQTIERSKAFLLLFMHIMASGLSLICFTHAMPMTKSTWSTMFLHFMGNVIGMSLFSSLGVLRPENELNYDVRRMRAAIVPGTMHFLMTYTLFSWYRRNYETYALALWCGVSQWVPFVLKKLLIGDVPRNEPTSHTEYKNYVENGDEDPLLSGAEEAGKVDHPNGSSSSGGENGAAMSLGDDHVPSSGRNYAHWILKHLFGVVIRRPHIASFEEMWALRVISACFVGMWAENKTLGSVGEPHLWERPLTFIATYFAMDLFFQLHETRKEIGRPLYITRLVRSLSLSHTHTHMNTSLRVALIWENEDTHHRASAAREHARCMCTSQKASSCEFRRIITLTSAIRVYIYVFV